MFKYFMPYLVFTLVFSIIGCKEDRGVNDVLDESTQGWIEDLESGTAYAEEVLSILQSVSDDVSAEQALEQLQGMNDRRQAYRETKHFIPGVVSQDLVSEYDAALDRFKQTNDQIQQEIYRIRGRTGDAPVISDESLMNRLTQAAF